MSRACSQKPRAIDAKKRAATSGHKVRGSRVPALGRASPADLHGSARRVLVQAQSYRAINREHVVEVSGRGFSGSMCVKEDKILSFGVKTPTCQGEGRHEQGSQWEKDCSVNNGIHGNQKTDNAAQDSRGETRGGAHFDSALERTV